MSGADQYPAGHSADAPVYVISVAAELAGLHPQTLRQYDRLGLVSPARTGGRNRMYSARDIQRLREVTQLSEAGISLEGIRRILRLESEVAELQARIDTLTQRQRSTALVLYQGRRRRTG